MKNILIIMSSLYNGGAEKSLVNFLNELDETYYSVDLLLFKKKGMFFSQVPSWVNILETPIDLQQLYCDKIQLGSLMLTKIIGTVISKIFSKQYDEQRGFRWKKFYSSHIKPLPKHYDLVFAYISGEVMYFASEKVNANKKVVMIHSDYRASQFPKKYDYEHLKSADKIATISERCVSIFKEEFPEFSDKIFLLPNLTSSKLIWKRSQEFVPQELMDENTTIMSIGRLSMEKGFDMAIEAAAMLKSKNIVFKWLVIGNGKMEEELREKIKKYRIEDCFILLGVRENPYPYIKHCNIFVQPSRYEGKSVVLDEAKILAKPIVVTNYPTVGDQLNDKEGLIVEMSPEGIAQGIIEMLNDNKSQLYSEYLSEREYGNQKDIELYYKFIDD